MGTYSQYISPKRKAVKAPEALINNGKAAFGTFEGEIKKLNMLEARKAICAPRFFNKYRLTKWEAFEAFFNEGILIVGFMKMGVHPFFDAVFYDKKENKVYSFFSGVSNSKSEVADNLLEGSRTGFEQKSAGLEFINDFQVGKFSLKGHSVNKKGDSISFAMGVVKHSSPSVVSIPFGANRPLYSEKNLMKINGWIEINGRRYIADNSTFGTFDDHKGFYPHHSHYDWLSLADNEKGFGVNLTKNQSLDPDSYNENIFWRQGGASLLPPVEFSKQGSLKKLFKGLNEKVIWNIKDPYDMVNLTFTFNKAERIYKNYLLIKVDYYMGFGKVSGYIRDEDGNLYNLDNKDAITEDKTVLF